MGGRGSSYSGGGSRRPSGAGGGGGGNPFFPNKPVDHITKDQMDSMTDAEFASNYVNYHHNGAHGGSALASEGLNPMSAQQILVNDLGMHGKPTVMDNSAFDAMVASTGARMIHRGVGTQASRDNTVYGGKQFVGGSMSVFGQGLYFSTLKRTAAGYAGWGAGSKNKITAVVDKKKAKMVDWNTVQREASAAGIYNRKDYNCWAIKHGYNCVRVKNANYNGGHEDFYIPLDRSILIVRKDSLVH